MINWKQDICKKKFHEKYMINGEKSEREVFEGIADEISQNDKKYRGAFYELLINQRFIPAGRTLANARPYAKNKYYNNCYTSPITDSLDSIYTAVKNHALISQTGGGNGINYSKIRPINSPLSRGGYASGPVSWMKVFNTSGKIIKTGGNRRNAQIALLSVVHPDIKQFITCKKGDDNNELDQMNLSASITDKFMNVVKKGKKWSLKFDDKIYERVDAREIFETICKNAYIHNEPGVFFVDRVNEDNNSWEYDLDSVNPCGELPLPSSGGVCNLGAMNLTKYVNNIFEDNAEFDYGKFIEDIKLAVRFLDGAIDCTNFPLPHIEELQLNWRRIGLGFTGLANAMAMLKIKYGSKESVLFTEQIARTLRDTSYIASSNLAKEKGSFPKYDQKKLFNKEKSMVKKLPEDIKELIKKNGLRNIGLNTVAPCGTISFTIGQNCSSGIEPTFNFKANRTILNTKEEKEVFETYDYAYLLFKEKYPDVELPEYFVTTLDIDPYRSVDVQAAAQKYIDHSISRTINLPLGYTYDQYKDIFMYAYESGLKGLTSYNPDGSQVGILEHEGLIHITRRMSPERPKDLECDIHNVSVNGVKYVALVGKLNGTLYELFVAQNRKEFDFDKHKSGIIRKQKRSHYSLLLDGDALYFDNIVDEMDGKDHEQTIARFISMSLRHGTPLQFIVTQLNREKNFIGFSKCIARVLKKYIKNGEIVATSEKCPDCGAKLVFYNGCKGCSECTWAKCD